MYVIRFTFAPAISYRIPLINKLNFTLWNSVMFIYFLFVLQNAAASDEVIVIHSWIWWLFLALGIKSVILTNISNNMS